MDDIVRNVRHLCCAFGDVVGHFGPSLDIPVLLGVARFEGQSKRPPLSQSKGLNLYSFGTFELRLRHPWCSFGDHFRSHWSKIERPSIVRGVVVLRDAQNDHPSENTNI